MKKVLDFFDNFEERMLVIILPIMVITIFMATFFRFTKLMSVPWAEELARYLMIWLVFLGIGAGAKENKHFTVDNVVMAFPKSTHRAFFILRTIIIVSYSVIIAYIGTGLIKSLRLMNQSSPALRVPIWTMYAAIIVGMILMIIRTLQFAYKYLKTDMKDITDI